LQEVISDYDGTVLIVSHDRDFLDRTVNLTLGLTGSGKVDIIVGGYADWVAKRDRDNNVETRKKADKFTVESGSHSRMQKAVKLSYKDQRDYDLLPTRIAEIDCEVAAAEKELSDPALYNRNHARFTELTAKADMLRTEKDAAEERWLELAMIVEEMAG
jgi:ABC transport system ATP-binding/permease protein